MNREFALRASPSLARRLLLMQSRCPSRMRLPDSLNALATEATVSDAEFDEIICPPLPMRKTATQFLLDSKLRGIVQARYHPELNAVSMLNIARLSGCDKISVLTNEVGQWRRAANALFISNIEISPFYRADWKWIDARRSGMLIIDLDGSFDRTRMFKLAPLVREFPRLILYQSEMISLDQLIPWPVLAETLTMRRVEFDKQSQSSSVALFYNVCIFPEYISSETILTHLRNIDSSAIRLA